MSGTLAIGSQEAVAGGLAETASSMALESFFKDAEGKTKDDAGPVMGEQRESDVEQNSEYTEKAVEAAAKAHDREDLMDNSIDEKPRVAARARFPGSGNEHPPDASSL
ncbi:hypothetical protein ACH4KO_34410 [Streptomyces anulatus]